MVTWELDSFFVKFKNLLRAEKDATITFKSEAGRASVSLSVNLGHEGVSSFWVSGKRLITGKFLRDYF